MRQKIDNNRKPPHLLSENRTVRAPRNYGGENSGLDRIVPPRSQFYHLDPISIGNPLVESFTSYVMRVAQEQNLNLREIAAVALSGVPNPPRDDIPSLANAHVLDEASNRVVEWVSAFERATERTDLKYLTLLPLREVVIEGVLCQYRKWCPVCLDEWRVHGQVVYEPLLWRFKAGYCCPVHGCALECKCPLCLRHVKLLGSFSRPGYCELCRGWLGSPGNKTSDSAAEANDPKWRTSREIAGLLKILTSIRPQGARAAFQQNLSLYIQQIVGGNVQAFAAYIGCPSSAVIHQWLAGTRMPQFDYLLKISNTLSVPLAKLFDSSEPTAEAIANAKASVERQSRRDVYPSRRASEIRLALLEALKKPDPPRLLDVAQQLGYRSNKGLYKADRELSRRINERFRQSSQHYFNRKTSVKEICDHKVLKQALLDALNSNEPVSLTRIAITHGYAGSGSIQYHFPKLYATVASKVRADEVERRQMIRRGLEDALREYPAPSLMTVVFRLGYKTSAVLRGNEPKLTGQIVDRYRRRFEERKAELAKKAESMIAENPPPSVKELCMRLGISVKTLNRHAQEIRKEAALRHREWKRADTKRRHKEVYQEIHEIAVALVGQGLYPAPTRILKLLSPHHKSCWHVITDAIGQARDAVTGSYLEKGGGGDGSKLPFVNQSMPG